MNSQKHIAISGAGLVGSLLAIYLIKRSYKVSVFERRADMRKAGYVGGRSINLALSTRGIRSLEEVGLADEIKKVAIPMSGRMIHDRHGEITFQPYGEEGQYINSISRSNLNLVLMNRAEELGVQFYFDCRITGVDFEKNRLHIENHQAKEFDLIIGADGAFSAVRGSMQITDRFDYSQNYIEHGYKEFHIPAGTNGSFQMEKNALHIWPRASYMLIALPNPDATFTCTLFFPFEGKNSFSTLNTPDLMRAFFQENFPDALALMPHFKEDFTNNPTSSLVTVRCFPWVKNRAMLIGDAAHAIVPFFGQGMNAGFEDCRILNNMLDQFSDNWDKVLPDFQKQRKPDTDAIAQLALDNFIEMRDLVADPKFLLRKKIEARLHDLFPARWIPQYAMVTFSEGIRYSDAYAIGQRQKKIMDDVMKRDKLEESWERLDFEKIVNQLT